MPVLVLATDRRKRRTETLFWVCWQACDLQVTYNGAGRRLVHSHALVQLHHTIFYPPAGAVALGLRTALSKVLEGRKEKRLQQLSRQSEQRRGARVRVRVRVREELVFTLWWMLHTCSHRRSKDRQRSEQEYQRRLSITCEASAAATQTPLKFEQRGKPDRDRDSVLRSPAQDTVPVLSPSPGQGRGHHRKLNECKYLTT